MDVSAPARSGANASCTSSGPTAATQRSSAETANARSAAAGARPGGGAGVPFAHLLAAASGRAGKSTAATPEGASRAGRGAGGAGARGAHGNGAGADGALDASPGPARRRAGHGRADGDGEDAEGEGTGVTGRGEGAGACADDDPDARTRAGDRYERGDADVLDPSARHLAQLGAPATFGNGVDAAGAQGGEPVRARSLEELLPALVRRIAWAGDRHKGTVRLELGAGSYAGTTVTVHADGGRVRVEIGGHEGPELDRLRQRLDARLRGHGLDVESVT